MHLTEWCTVCHLFYPQGESINDHIPRIYVLVDNTIHILQSLGSAAFMAKTDLKSAFLTALSGFL